MILPCVRSRRQKILLLWLSFYLAAALSSAQDATVDLNDYYRFPLSLGFEYQSLSPFTEYGSQYNIFDLALNVRWPIPTLPVLQPAARLGITRFDSQDASEPEKWDNTHGYAGLGAVYAHRFAKSFEIGGEAIMGFSVAYFPNLLPELSFVHATHFFLEAGARIAIDPSYNFTIDVHPNLRYLVSLGDFKDYNGLIFGIGFGAAYRFGQDPDAPAAVIRSLRFSELSIPPIFAAMQSYYVQNPVGTVTMTNTERFPITDLEVSFFQPGYMDSPTPAASIAELAAGESRQVPLYASYNQEVFTTEGVTPLTGEVIVTYRSRSRAAEQHQSVAYDLHDKTAVTWDDDRKVAAFITPSDSALRNYTSFIHQICKDQIVAGYNEAVQIAVQVYEALGEIGCLYQADPTSPFTRVHDDPRLVDSVSLPRDTLKRITGDCDDLTVLFCSLLETVGIETALITVPGHIYAAFNTGAGAAEYGTITSDRRQLISLDGELWVPVEITLVGRSDFLEAWRRGTDEWAAYENQPESRGLYRTRVCQQLYRPVSLRETDLGLQYGSEERIREAFSRDLNRLIDEVLRKLVQAAEQNGRASDYNRLGIAYARVDQYQRAERSFREALHADPRYINARINLANLLYLDEEYEQALTRFHEVYGELDRRQAGQSEAALVVLINMFKTCERLSHYEEGEGYLEQARRIDPEGVAAMGYPDGGGAAGERAASAAAPGLEIVFAGEEDGE